MSELPKEWVETTLGDIAEINPRETIKKGTMAKSVPMDKLASFNKKITGFEIKEFKGGCKFKNGDTLLARITPCLENGKTAYVDILNDGEVGFGSTEYIVIREKEKLSDKHFLFYFSISPRFRKIAIKLMNGTSGRQRVQTTLLTKKIFSFPPFPEQKAIANILSVFDQKIELLREQNETLETLAQTIFKEWFVKFNYPNATGERVDSELGEIPKGWHVEGIRNLVQHLKVTVNPQNKPNDIFCHYSLPAFDSGKTPEIQVGNTINSNKYKVIDKCFLVSKLNPSTPRIWTIYEPVYNSICSTEFQVIKPIEYETFGFTYGALTSYGIKQELSARSHGTSSSHQRVKPDDILDCSLIIPTQNIINDYSMIVNKLLEKFDNNLKQIQLLTKTRNTLLPKLMSGEVRVKGFGQ